MIPEVPLNLNNPWETPPTEPDLELVETSRRLVALSDQTFIPKASLETTSVETIQDPRIAELETQNHYLFQRNIALVAKVAELEAANLRLQEKVSVFQTDRTPWLFRWLGMSR